MRRLRNYSESLGDEYSWDVVSSCEQNSMQAIATNDDILIYDPKNGLYCRHSDVIKNSDLEAGIFDMLSDPSLKRQVMRPAKGDDFNKFASEWNALQKEDRPDILKTKKTTTFAFNTNEGRKPSKDFMDSKVEKFRKRWRKLGAGAGGGSKSGLSKKDRDHLDRLKDYHDDFGDKVNGIEAQVSEGNWFKPKPIPGLGQAVVNWKDGTERPLVLDHIRSLSEVLEVLDGMSAREPEGDLPEIDNIRIDDKTYNFDDIEKARDEMYTEEYEDDPNDWSASEGEVEIVWDNDFPRFGIEAGDTEPFVIDYDRVDTHDQLMEEVVRLIEEAYPGIEVGTDDFVIDNEDEFWEQRGGNPGKLEDDDDLYLESDEEEFTVRWLIDDEVLGIEVDDIETVVVDLDLVDSFDELVRQATMELKRNHDGMRFDYDVDWVFPNEDELLKRFGYSMNE